jgi:iron complex outermembrane receptor protein
MTPTPRATLSSFNRFIFTFLNALLLTAVASIQIGTAQQPAQTGSVGGRVTDESGAPVVGADVILEQTTIGTRTRADGDYLLPSVPAGNRSVR